MDGRGDIEGINVMRGGTKLTHLLFVYDCVIFIKATLEEWKNLNRILEVYKYAYGQCLNKEEATIFFSSNVRKLKG